MNTVLALPLDDIAAFCRRHPIRRLSLFGSALRGGLRADSDIDLLVEFEATARISLLDMAAFEIELGELLGRKVDLRTKNELSRYFRDEVLQSAEPLYERA